jgi:hypothetical protein
MVLMRGIWVWGWMSAWVAAGLVAVGSANAQQLDAGRAIDIGSRRELFVDHFLIDHLQNAALKLHTPQDAGTVMVFDRPWEGRYCIYGTILHDGDLYRLYYRGMPQAKHYKGYEKICYAESRDGIHWTRPDLGLIEIDGSRRNNVILNDQTNGIYTFAPFIDTRPGVSPQQRYKALGNVSVRTPQGRRDWALVALSSPDGIHWERMREEPVIVNDTDHFAFDSQNVAFWSESEQRYVAYGRTWKDGIRRISRFTSDDFIHWSGSTLMVGHRNGQPVTPEHLYINQTQSYFRAPHIYVATPARLVMKQALSKEQIASLALRSPSQARSIADTVLATSRGGNVYDRTFMESWIRPGIGPQNWVTRNNYSARGIVQTGPAEMSIYIHEDYGQPTNHLQRYTLRLDGFISVNAPYQGGEMVTKPLIFAGRELVINYATSAAGSILVEIQDAKGQPIPGYALGECLPIIGDEIERAVSWQGGADVSSLAGRPVRLRFVMKDADLYSLRFTPDRSSDQD